MTAVSAKQSQTLIIKEDVPYTFQLFYILPRDAFVKNTLVLLSHAVLA